MITGRVFFSAAFSYVENAYAELARHIIKGHHTLTFHITVLSPDEV